MPNTTYTNNNYQLPASAADLAAAEYGHPQQAQVAPAPHCDTRDYYQPMEPPAPHQVAGHMHPAAVDPQQQHRPDMYRGYERPPMHMRANGNHQQPAAYYPQPPPMEMTDTGGGGGPGYDNTMEQYRTHSPSQYPGTRYMPCKMQEGMNGGVPNGMPDSQYMQTQTEPPAGAEMPPGGQQVMYTNGGQPPPAGPPGQQGGAASPNVLFPWMRTQFGELRFTWGRGWGVHVFQSVGSDRTEGVTTPHRAAGQSNNILLHFRHSATTTWQNRYIGWLRIHSISLDKAWPVKRIHLLPFSYSLVNEFMDWRGNWLAVLWRR